MNLTEHLHSGFLILDGGMGTLLQAQGLKAGELPERWNLTHPELIADIHRRYYDAGSHLVNANTFGANSLKFDEDELDRIVCAAIENARAGAAASVGGQEKWVALDIGPSGRMLAPLGDFDFEDAVECFGQTVRLGVKYGADAIFIETMNDSYETKAALLAAKENCDLPIFVSCAYGEDGKLMTGASPAAMVAMLEGMGADCIGVNCSLGPRALAGVVREYLAHASVPILLKPNAGLPRVEEGRTVYDVAPEEFAAQVTELASEGVRAVGGCCGTTPEYIAALCERMKGLSPLPITEKQATVVSSYTHAVTFGEIPLLIGERINPTGKKRFAQALREGDMDYLLREGLNQQERGVHLLDVNVGLPDIDEKAMLLDAVTRLQAVCDLPLQVDTANAEAMEAALRRYNGKALINSVSGKRESMDAVFPLVRKYGGTVVALTLDEEGIPPTAEGRLAIARRILAEAETWGIAKKDLIFDPLALTISADGHAAVETLRAVELIGDELGCRTSLGVSNVSFGLPEREWVTASFFTMALDRGLSAAIMNPYSEEMHRAYRTYLALSGKDANCMGYIAYAKEAGQQATAVAVPSAKPIEVGPAEACASALQKAIGRGMAADAARLTDALLAERDAMDIVNSEIIPALDAVGEGFEKKTVYLPQLLMSAEAASAAFERIKASLGSARAKHASAPFVLATVKGDIHDIGKNIVKLLLENYGFTVLDLGRDVPTEAIVEAVIKHGARVCGLSALMTTTVPAMEQTIRQLRKAAPDCRVVVGGAVLNEAYAARIGADAYAKDAMETVRYAERVYGDMGASADQPKQ